jgi:hypothetical protein
MKTNSIFVIRGSSFTNIRKKKIYCHCPLTNNKIFILDLTTIWYYSIHCHYWLHDWNNIANFGACMCQVWHRSIFCPWIAYSLLVCIPNQMLPQPPIVKNPSTFSKFLFCGKKFFQINLGLSHATDFLLRLIIGSGISNTTVRSASKLMDAKLVSKRTIL